ncbi:MAG: response regulator, partial [Thiopseudomonas sp.]
MIDFSKMRFLVVDDFSEFRSSIRGILGLLAVQKIDTAANGEEVLELCRRNRYDVILHDYNLGDGVSGQQVLERLHAEKLLSPHCIFIMVTAENTQAMVLAAIECEPDDYLSKPFSKVSLQTRLERMVRRKQVLAPVLTAMENRNFAQVLQA